MRRLALLSLLALTGCATYNLPVDSDVNVGRTDAIEGGTMAVIVRNVVVEDEGGLAAHVGPGEPTEVYRAYIIERIPGEIRRQSTVTDAFVGEPDDASPLAFEVPTNGTTFTFEGRTPEWVLILKDVTLLRAKYSNGGMMFGQPGGETRAVRNDVEILLWDNREGLLVASGEVESEERILFAPSEGTYEAAVGEFVEKLIENTPMESLR